MIELIIAVLIASYSIASSPKDITNTQELANWAKCDTEKIAYFVSQKIEYTEQSGWRDGNTCIALGKGDCKCKAAVANEALLYCVGYTPRIATIIKGDDKHAVVLFTDHIGRRGFIDNSNTKRFSANTEWQDIINTIGGGPWTEN